MNLLNRILTTRKIPHALLLSGSGDLERQARDFAKRLLETTQEHHPDLHIYQPEGKTGMHALPSIRALIHEVGLHPFQAPYKVCLVLEAQRMLPTSSNALLKTLEEPPSHTLIILLVKRVEELLPTLVSRCQRVTIQGLPSTLPYLSVEQLLERGEQIEQRRKVREEQLRKDLPKELTGTQREQLEKEMDGVVTLQYQEEVRQLLQALLETQWDLCKKSSRRLPLGFEEALQRCMLGVQRGIKLSICLEVLKDKLDHSA